MFTSRVTTAAWAPSEELQITSKLVCSRDPQGPCAGSFQRVCEDEPRTRSHARHGSHSLPLLASSLSCAWAAWGTELVQISMLQVSTRDWAAIDDDHLKKKPAFIVTAISRREVYACHGSGHARDYLQPPGQKR